MKPLSVKCLARKVVETVTRRERYAVHRALMQYTLCGLRRIGHRPIYDPVLRSQCSSHVIVMGFDENLAWTVPARAAGRLRFLAMGPLMAYAIRKELLRFLALEPHIDRIFVASEYYRTRCCEEAPELSHLFTVWSCGIDTSLWTPAPVSVSKPRVVVYQKNAPEATLGAVLEELAKLQVDVRLLKYGTYAPEDFRSALEGAMCAVLLSRWESQGIAMAEAWSCNVPTLVWKDDPASKRPYSAPLLTEATGRFFSAASELPDCVRSCESPGMYSPRRWVLEHLTAERQAKRLLELCGLSAPDESQQIMPTVARETNSMVRL